MSVARGRSEEVQQQIARHYQTRPPGIRCRSRHWLTSRPGPRLAGTGCCVYLPRAWNGFFFRRSEAAVAEFSAGPRRSRPPTRTTHMLSAFRDGTQPMHERRVPIFADQPLLRSIGLDSWFSGSAVRWRPLNHRRRAVFSLAFAGLGAARRQAAIFGCRRSCKLAPAGPRTPAHRRSHC